MPCGEGTGVDELCGEGTEPCGDVLCGEGAEGFTNFSDTVDPGGGALWCLCKKYMDRRQIS